MYYYPPILVAYTSSKTLYDIFDSMVFLIQLFYDILIPDLERRRNRRTSFYAVVRIRGGLRVLWIESITDRKTYFTEIL